MPVSEKIKSVSDLLTLVNKHTINDDPLWFRGHAKVGWQLAPSLYRSNSNPEKELSLLRRFQQHSVSFLKAPPRHEWEWLFLMQHYAVPTRLLDWSESPLVALYFAVSSDKTKDGTLWMLNPRRLNGLSGYPCNGIDIPSFGVDDDVLKPYLPSGINQPPQDRKPLAILAQRQFPRLYAQQGVFTIFHKDRVGLDKLNPATKGKDHIVGFTIPANKKSSIKNDLEHLGVDELSLFPELEKVAARVRGLSK